MAQSALTVTAPNPTPPTNVMAGYANTFGSTTQTKPPSADYASTVWNDPWHPGVTNPTQPAGNNPSGVTTSTAPPYLDDGTATSVVTFGAPASGTAHEGAGTETLATATYSSAVMVPGSAATYIPTGQTPAWADGAPGGPVRTDGCGPALTVGVMPQPNGSHPSSALPALTLGTPSSVSGASGTYSQTVTGTGFTRQSVIYVNGQAQVTTYNSTTSLTAAAVTKKTSPGTWPVFVGTGVGMPVSATATWTFT